jgi:hypothetical protein
LDDFIPLAKIETIRFWVDHHHLHVVFRGDAIEFGGRQLSIGFIFLQEARVHGGAQGKRELVFKQRRLPETQLGPKDEYTIKNRFHV